VEPSATARTGSHGMGVNPLASAALEMRCFKADPILKKDATLLK